MNAAKIIMTMEGAMPAGGLTSGDIIASASAIIALASLGLAWWIGSRQSKHFRLSSKPLLELNLSTSGLLVELENHGFGPAALEKFTATYGEGTVLNLLRVEEVRTLTRELVAGVEAVGPNYCGALSKDGIIGAGRKFPVVRIERAFKPDEVDRVRANFRRITFSMTYRCIYGTRETTTQVGFS